MNNSPPRKMNGFIIIVIIILFLILLFGVWRLSRGEKYVGYTCIIFVVALLFIYLWRTRNPKKIPFSVIKQDYIKAMEKEEKISINPLAKTEMMTEEGDRYVFVLYDESETPPQYYMSESSMYERNTWGRGFGQHSGTIVDATQWFVTRNKTNVTEVLAQELNRQVLREVMLKQKEQMMREQQMKNIKPQESEFK